MASANFKDTSVFRKAFALAMRIFEISKTFPIEEKYSLQYLSSDDYLQLSAQSKEVGKLLAHMLANPDRY